MRSGPVLVVGGTASGFLGEYMAGGLLIVLDLRGQATVSEGGIGSGIHGGEIFIRGKVDEKYLGIGAKRAPADAELIERIRPVIENFAGAFGIDPAPLRRSFYLVSEFTRITQASTLPFADNYTWECDRWQKKVILI